MKLGFVFTNFNNYRFTAEAVRSIAASSAWGSSRVVIVDNNSEGSDVAQLQRMKIEYPGVHVILNTENIGYFRGLNVGLRHLREAYPDVDHVVVGNNDLFFPPSFASDVARKRDLFDHYPVIAPDLVTLDGVHQNPHVISRISKIREAVWDVYYSNYVLALLLRQVARLSRRLTERRDYEEYTVARTIHQGYGACYILGPIFFRDFGELWAPTFLMGEEYFLSMQLERKGYAVYYEPSILVQHHDHATLDKVPSKRLWEIARDAHRVYRKYVKVVDWP
jgi:GT2 family glycosyltransferase